MGGGIFTEESMKRYKVLEELKARRIGVKEASELLGLSYRHVLRLKKRYEEEGIEGLKFSKRGRKPQISEQDKELIIHLYFHAYEGRLNISHFRDEFLEERLRYSYKHKENNCLYGAEKG